MASVKVRFVLLSALAVMFMTMRPVEARPEPIADDRAVAAVAAALKTVVKDFIAKELEDLLTNITTKKKETDLMCCYWNDWKKRDKKAKKQKTYNSCR
jgi:hypothetical protein